MPGLVGECLCGRQCACAGRKNACAGRQCAWTGRLNVWRVGNVPGRRQSAWAVGKNACAGRKNAWAVGKVPARLAMCMCSWLNVWRVGKCLASRQMPVRSAMGLGWSEKCLRGWLNACAGRQNVWAVGNVPRRSAKCLANRQKCLAGWQMPRRLAMCMCGWQCACVGRLNACTVGNVPGRLAIQGFSAGKDLLGNFYRVHGIFSVEVGTNHVSIFLRKNGTSDNNLAPRRFFTQQLDCFFH